MNALLRKGTPIRFTSTVLPAVARLPRNVVGEVIDFGAGQCIVHVEVGHVHAWTERLEKSDLVMVLPSVPINYPPVAKGNGPKNSKLAAKLHGPRRPSAARNVFFHLFACRGQWVDGYVLSEREVGGTEGIRRLRELRQAGWPIEEMPTDNSTWLYRYCQTCETGPHCAVSIKALADG